MKAIVDKETLLSILEPCGPICSGKHANQMLTRVKLDVSRDGIRFMATDTVVTFQGSRDVVECDNGSAFAASCQAMTDGVTKMPAGRIRLDLDGGGTLTIQSGKRSFRMVTVPADDFPAAPKEPSGGYLLIPGSALASVIGRVRFAMSSEERAHDGIALTLKGGVLEACALDGRKVALATEKTTVKGELSVIMPPRVVPLVLAVCQRYAADIGIMTTGSALHLDTEAGKLRYSSSVSGSFPPTIRGALELADGPTFRHKVKPMVDVIKYAAAVSPGAAPRVTLTVAKSKLHVLATDGQREASDEIDIDTDAELTIPVNPQFTVDAMVAAGDEAEVTRGPNMLRVRSDGFVAGIAGLFG